MKGNTTKIFGMRKDSRTGFYHFFWKEGEIKRSAKGADQSSQPFSPTSGTKRK
ncbi:hypothetical protein FUAX_13330 [Fulvitalea axinellae]|uniref:Uncharacterized protein n=1 Tax=Fulvitalea axinellae TaxID=1182444 RepID=A0AAU9C9T0_9BACT|nr:hypothetical protein FUAX_13330 [Fulvitalea axinellae]